MKKSKVLLLLVLVTAMLFIAACNGGGAALNGEAQNEAPPDDSQYQPAVTLPAPLPEPMPEQEETPPATDDVQNEDYVEAVPLPGEVEVDADVEWEEWPDVIVDGVGVQGSRHRIVGDEVFPNYVTLVPVAEAFGSPVNVDGNNVTLEGLDGNISFEIDSNLFTVGNETERLNNPAAMFDGDIYVPIEFFEIVFGAGDSYFAGGEVHINTDPGDMH